MFESNRKAHPPWPCCDLATHRPASVVTTSDATPVDWFQSKAPVRASSLQVAKEPWGVEAQAVATAAPFLRSLWAAAS